ncbi:hypothetical protein D3C79_386930 [compost metagenome]
MGLYPCCKALLAGLADHRGIATGIDLGFAPAMCLAERHLLYTCLGREHRLPAKVRVHTAGHVEKFAIIKIRRRRAAPIQRDVGIAGQGCQQQRLDAGVTCAGGEKDQRALVIVLPGTGAQRAFELYRCTCLQGGQQTFSEQAAADLADVKHQLPLCLGRQVGNGETAAVAVVQLKPHVLARPHLQRLSRLQHQLDDICAQRALANHLCLGFQCWCVQ